MKEKFHENLAKFLENKQRSDNIFILTSESFKNLLEKIKRAKVQKKRRKRLPASKTL